MSKKLLYAAFDEPNHTQTPNKLWDILPDMGEAELRVTLVMVRFTLGYHREQFKMGIGKLAAAAGLSEQGARNGAQAAEERGIFRRVNPDDKKEAVWELILLDPHQVDPQPSLPKTPTELTSDLHQVDHITGTKESIKESLKKTLIRSSPEFAMLAGATNDELTDASAEWQAREKSSVEFETALGFSNALRWDADRDWLRFAEWVQARYTEDAGIFRRYQTWRNTPFVKGAIDNRRIRGFVNEFYDSWDMFKMSESKNAVIYNEKRGL